MKGSTIAGVLVLGGMIAGAVLLSNGELVNVKPRAARIPCEKATKENCPAGIFEQKDYCLCLTVAKTGELADEKTVGDYRCDICEVTDPEAGKHLAVRYPKSVEPLGKNCITVANDLLLPGISMRNIPTGIEAQLEAACAPCKVGSGSWGPCPSCAYRGDCDKLCPVSVEPE